MSEPVCAGLLTPELLSTLPGVPGTDRLEQGPVAVIECAQEIPCNPCCRACPQGAITVAPGITALPRLHGEKCTGCGLCIPKCPGLAIFTVHKNYSETTSLVSFPYEYLPLPAVGDTVPCAGRDGRYLTDGVVKRVLTPASYDHTAVVTVEVPKEHCMTVRTIQRSQRGGDGK